MNLYKMLKVKKIRMNYSGYDLKFKLNKFDDTEILKEIFVDEIYNFLNVKDKIVVDIGAFIGDTAIYFLIKGANMVISLEPDLNLFHVANMNINYFVNKYPEFLNKVVLLNLGYGFIDLKDIVNKYNIDHGILKIDCEGCEYNILNEDNDILRKFDMIQLEYHYGYESLVKKLKECKFNVKYIDSRKVYDINAKTTFTVGEIYASK